MLGVKGPNLFTRSSGISKTIFINPHEEYFLKFSICMKVSYKLWSTHIGLTLNSG